LNDAEFEKISLACKEKFAAAANRRCKFERGRQLFVGTHNESPSIAVMRVNNPDRLAALIYRRNTTPTPSGFTEIVGNDFPGLHAITSLLNGIDSIGCWAE
jgi:hypothetical protein